MNQEKINPEPTDKAWQQKIVNASLRSEAAQELINRKGGFLEQRALMVLVVVLLFLVAGTWFIRYPDIINASATLTAENAPKEVVGFQTGRLVRLFVKNGDVVHKEQVIAWGREYGRSCTNYCPFPNH